jgi:protein-tyrosine phosphatase
MFDRVLTVCVGNICRSPMAEALLRARLHARNPDAVVESAGIAALVGKPADPIAVALMSERGLDLSAHRARQLTPELARRFELVLVMEAGHQREVEAAVPALRGASTASGASASSKCPTPTASRAPPSSAPSRSSSAGWMTSTRRSASSGAYGGRGPCRGDVRTYSGSR